MHYLKQKFAFSLKLSYTRFETDFMTIFVKLTYESHEVERAENLNTPSAPIKCTKRSPV